MNLDLDRVTVPILQWILISIGKMDGAEDEQAAFLLVRFLKQTEQTPVTGFF